MFLVRETAKALGSRLARCWLVLLMLVPIAWVVFITTKWCVVEVGYNGDGYSAEQDLMRLFASSQ